MSKCVGRLPRRRAGCTRYDRRAPAHYDPEYPAVRHITPLSGKKTTYAVKVVKGILRRNVSTFVSSPLIDDYCYLWPPCVIGQAIYIFSSYGFFFFFFMVALWNRADHYIFIQSFVLLFSSFLSSPNLSRRRLDVCHTCTHGVALVRI